jgi:TIR domain
LKNILVTGTSRPWDTTALRAAPMVGVTLADHGFGLVTGNASGVDKAAADAFCSQVKRIGADVAARYTQLTLPYTRRGSLWPIAGYAARKSSVPLRSTHEWLQEATARCAAVIMLGGHAGRVRGKMAGRGALGIVNRFIEAGKPVFPVPFTGGRSDEVFQEVLSRWAESPVPGLSRTQFLRIALPWTSGTGQLADLLLGTLAEAPDIFISYRRDDTAWVSGRLYRELSEYFGAKRVFMDLEHIVAGDTWKKQIEWALDRSHVGLVIIGDRWLEPDSSTGRPRLADEADVVRMEIRKLLANCKAVIVVLAGTGPPRSKDLPQDLLALSQIHAVAITNATWETILQQIIGTIRRALSSGAT